METEKVTFLKVLKEVTHKVSVASKNQIKVLKTSAECVLIKVWSYESKDGLYEKGHFEMNTFNPDTKEGMKTFKGWIATNTNCRKAIEHVNTDVVRLAQNSNRIWDKKSETSQLKTDSLKLAKDCLSGKFGDDMKKIAEKEFPKDKYPSLY